MGRLHEGHFNSAKKPASGMTLGAGTYGLLSPRDRQRPRRKHKQRASHTPRRTSFDYLGRKPSFTRDQLQTVRNMLELEAGTSAIPG